MIDPITSKYITLYASVNWSDDLVMQLCKQTFDKFNICWWLLTGDLQFDLYVNIFLFSKKLSNLNESLL